MVPVMFANRAFNEVPFRINHAVNILFNRFFGDEFEDMHAAALPHPVHAVGRLVLFGWIPPTVVMDHD